MAADWYVELDGKNNGPYSLVQLKKLVEHGRMGRDTIVIHEGKRVKATAIPGLFGAAVITESEPEPESKSPPIALGLALVVGIPVVVGGILFVLRSRGNETPSKTVQPSAAVATESPTVSPEEGYAQAVKTYEAEKAKLGNLERRHKLTLLAFDDQIDEAKKLKQLNDEVYLPKQKAGTLTEQEKAEWDSVNTLSDQKVMKLEDERDSEAVANAKALETQKQVVEEARKAKEAALPK